MKHFANKKHYIKYTKNTDKNKILNKTLHENSNGKKIEIEYRLEDQTGANYIRCPTK